MSGTSALAWHLGTCLAPRHLLGTSTPAWHLGTCSAPDSILGAEVPALTPLNTTKDLEVTNNRGEKNFHVFTHSAYLGLATFKKQKNSS